MNPMDGLLAGLVMGTELLFEVANLFRLNILKINFEKYSWLSEDTFFKQC